MDNWFFPGSGANSSNPFGSAYSSTPFYNQPSPMPDRSPYTTPKTGTSRVVPVHYANDKPRSGFTDFKHRSTKLDRSAAAIRIQKIIRGFIVRKNMRKIKNITAEMAEIGLQISALKLCDNAKQRLWIGEMLMKLLLRLDAARGVREYRKKVIRRVIKFQEAVDSFAQGSSVKTAEICTGAIEAEAVENGGEIACEEIKESFGIGLSIEDSTEESLEIAEVTPSGSAEQAMTIKTLKRMVEDLCEKSLQQCELLRLLVQRVEELESRVQDMQQRKEILPSLSS